jgi:hypothetical protein
MASHTAGSFPAIDATGAAATTCRPLTFLMSTELYIRKQKIDRAGEGGIANRLK